MKLINLISLLPIVTGQLGVTLIKPSSLGYYPVQEDLHPSLHQADLSNSHTLVRRDERTALKNFLKYLADFQYEPDTTSSSQDPITSPGVDENEGDFEYVYCDENEEGSDGCFCENAPDYPILDAPPPGYDTATEACKPDDEGCECKLVETMEDCQPDDPDCHCIAPSSPDNDDTTSIDPIQPNTELNPEGTPESNEYEYVPCEDESHEGCQCLADDAPGY